MGGTGPHHCLNGVQKALLEAQRMVVGAKRDPYFWPDVQLPNISDAFEFLRTDGVRYNRQIEADGGYNVSSIIHKVPGAVHGTFMVRALFMG